MTAGCKKRLFIDLETYSSVDITEAGAFRYVEAPDFCILLLAYAWDRDPVQVVDMTSRPEEARAVLDALLDPEDVKVAHNSAFERACLRRYTGDYMPPDQWEDTMIMCAMNGLPMSLDSAGAALDLKDQKIKEGVSLISYFCKPCKPTVSNGGRTRNLPVHAPDKWERFCTYCKRDVEVEQAIYYRLKNGVDVPEWERELFAADARINERGVMVDVELAESAVYVDDTVRAQNLDELRQLTGLENPNSVQQLRSWLLTYGLDVPSLDKAAMAELLARDDLSPIVRRVLVLRSLLGKTSTKKYTAMLEAASPADHRLRGMMQYYGAGRTGRWSGRIVQPQNLPQNHLDDIGSVREVVRYRDIDTLDMCFDSIPDTLSQLIRTALIAPPGHTFLVADYSAIEARVIAYLAGEKWRQDVFRNGGDIYCSSASQMFKVPVEKHGINGHLRQKGKIAELACGYGGGVGALKAFGADKMGLSDEEMQAIVTQWRAASPTIPRFWRLAETAAKSALMSPGRRFKVSQKIYDPTRARDNEATMGAEPGTFSEFFNVGTVCTYWKTKDALRCQLPSGRVLSYWGAYLENDEIHFSAQNQTTRKTTRKWEDSQTWGGKLVENIVQAYARDCLAVAILRLDALGYKICFSVHDELIAEEPEGGRSWQEMADVMGQPIDWAPGLLLRADGYETKFYMKD